MPTGPSDETTLASDAGSSGSAETRRASTPHSGWLSSSRPGDGAFASGTILADRYRIIGLLGRGGMGEVYRADDLRLGQPVALKFLPHAVSGDAVRLAQFHSEVRTARQVSHRNVCRVYDIGEADGRIFLTMEFVDGEDLSSLLKRIGRFPQDRAVEVARQLCAGLAAAHEKGVVHRDLKPANVMLDRDGIVRVTDFGLAALATEVRDVRAGTPAYMAPEQLAGREVSTRSDLFALGLVLFEIFTGRRAYDAKNLAELLRMHDEGLTLTPTSAVRDLDPAIERVILRCLEREPSRRPPSAIAVSAALPGGDPLAAALAAGETPSPEMVANTGRRDAVPAAQGLAFVALIVLGLVGLTALGYRTLIVHLVPFDRPPVVLADRARTILEALGYRDAPRDTDGGLGFDPSYVQVVERERRGPDRWREMREGWAPSAFYWYRTSPELLIPQFVSRRVGGNDPPLVVPGMTLVKLNTRGRLMEMEAVPPSRASDVASASPQTAPSAPSPSQLQSQSVSSSASPSPPAPAGAGPDWSRLFTAAELPMDRFTPATPEWTPRHYADRRAAWTGTLPGAAPDGAALPVRVEAAAYGDRVTSFRLIFPWTTQAGDQEETGDGATPRSLLRRVTAAISDSLYLIVTLVALVIARRHVTLRRGDRVGAFWLASAALAFALLQWALQARHVADIDSWEERFYVACGLALLQAARLWIFYLALEPIVRRYWPTGLIAWSRLVAGEWRDPLVGWHVLTGVACGVALHAMLAFGVMLPTLLGEGPPSPMTSSFFSLQSVGAYAGTMAGTVYNGLNTALFVAFCYAFAHRFLRRDLPASAAVVVLIFLEVADDFIVGANPGVDAVFVFLLSLLIVVLVRRFGLLAAACMFIVNQIIEYAPLTFDLSAWYAYQTIGCMAVILGLTFYGFVTSRAGEPLLGRAFAPDHADA